MIPAIEAITAITLYMGLMVVVQVGLGMAILSLCRIEFATIETCLTSYWLGFAATVGFLQVWHLFLPVNGVAFFILVLGSSAAIWANRLAIRRLSASFGCREIVVGGLLCVAAAAWISNNASGPPSGFDSGVYHVPAVEWYTHYPVVFGLGNLHDRLAFNGSELLYDAMLNTGWWKGRATHAANASLVLVLLLQILSSAVGCFRDRVGVASRVFDLCLILPVTAIVISHDISSFTTDIPPAIVLFVISSSAFRLLTREPTATRSTPDLLAIMILAPLSVCLKLSYMVTGPAFIVAALAFLGSAGLWQEVARAIKWAVVASLLLLIPWILHGIVLSGYPLYPATFGGLPVEWRIPTELADASRSWIVASSRHSVESGFSWVADWLGFQLPRPFLRAPLLYRRFFGLLVPLALAVASLSGILLVKRRRRFPDQAGRPVLFVAACAIGCVFWLCTAPGFRFGFPILWSLAAAMVALFARLSERHAGVLAVPGAVVLASVVLLYPLPKDNVLRTVMRRMGVRPGPDHGLYPYLKVSVNTFVTDSGLVLNVPVEENRCFDNPLPCTPHPAPNLILKTGVDGRPEFVTNGSWHQLNWPLAGPEEMKDKFLKKFNQNRE